MENLARRPIGMPRPENTLQVFNNTRRNPMTEANFTMGWQRAMVKPIQEGVITKRFTFHDLRAYYTTQRKEKTTCQSCMQTRPRRPGSMTAPRS